MSASKITALENRVADLDKRIVVLEKNLAELAVSGLVNKVETVLSPEKTAKVKVKRGPTAWSLFVKHVTADMKTANPDAKLKLSDIASEAKKRKDAGSYDEAHWKEMVSKVSA